jgi:hypothetical protein
MPILGLIDSATFANAVGVTINSSTVTKNAADEIAAGDIIVLGGVQYFVKAVVSDTEITLGTDYAGATNAALSGALRRTAPKALADYILGGGDSASSSVQIIGLSRAEAQLANNKARGLSSPGWWAYRTYQDAHGDTRHKAECIASFKDGSAMVGDYADEPAAADALSVITISAQPADFVTAAPAGGVLTFTDNGAADGNRTAGTYTITDAAGSVAGTGADFTVVVAGDGTPTITKVSGGTGYAAAETITIADADLGGGGGAAVVITVSTVATAAATFSVTASATAGTLAYQWQVSTNGRDFADISGETSATLSLTALTTTENGNKYRVRVNTTGNTGAAEVVSGEVLLTVNAA